MEQEFTEFSDMINHFSMNWRQFKDPVPNMSCWHCGSILVFNTRGGWMAGSSSFTVMTNVLSSNSVKTFRENSNELMVHFGEGWFAKTRFDEQT